VRFNEYLQLLYEIAMISQEHRRVLVGFKVISHLGDMYLGDQSPFEKDKKREKLGNRITPPNWTYLLKTMSVLIRSCTTDATAKFGNPPSQMPGEPIPYNAETDKKVIGCRDLYVVALSQGHCPEAMAEIITHWSFENATHSEQVGIILLHGIDRALHDSLAPYFDVMKPFVALKDSFQQNRIDQLLDPYKGVLNILYDHSLIVSCWWLPNCHASSHRS